MVEIGYGMKMTLSMGIGGAVTSTTTRRGGCSGAVAAAPLTPTLVNLRSPVGV